MELPLTTPLVEGATYRREMTITVDLMASFADLSGDTHRIHMDNEFAVNQGFKGRVGYGNLLGLMVSALVGMDLQRDDVMLVSQRLNFSKPFFIGDSLRLEATVNHLSEAVGVAELKLAFKNQADESIASGSCQVKILSSQA